MGSPAAIRIEGLTKTFGGAARGTRALDGLTLTVASGSVFGFLGPNGAGKTTTIRILVGLARPTAGRAWIDGLEVTSAPGTRAGVARRIGYLPQDPTFYPWMTPQEFVDHVGRLFGLPAGQRAARSRELLELAGLTQVAKRRIGTFSGGMRQRLGIAQALVNDPAVLLLDEPVSGLDPAGRRDLLELIEHLRGRCTVFMSTHILADVERVCDAVGILHQGRLVAEAPQEELRERYALPAFELEVEEPNGAGQQLASWSQSLQDLPWVVSVTTQNHTTRVVVGDVETAKRELVVRAIQAGLVLTRYEMVRPSLEDVFLKLVGES